MNKKANAQKPLLSLRAKITLLIVFAIPAAVIIFGTKAVINDTHDQRALKHDRVFTDATVIDRRFVTTLKGPTTYYVSYRFSAPSATGQQTITKHDYNVSSSDYDSLQIGDHLTVAYQSGHPDNNLPKFAIGVIPNDYILFLTLFAILPVFSLLSRVLKKVPWWPNAKSAGWIIFPVAILQIVAAVVIASAVVIYAVAPLLSYLLY